MMKILLTYLLNVPGQIIYLTNYDHFIFIPHFLLHQPLQSVVIGISNLSENRLLLKHLLLIFKYQVYNAREDGSLSIKFLEANNYETRNIATEKSKNHPTKTLENNRKWSRIDFILD